MILHIIFSGVFILSSLEYSQNPLEFPLRTFPNIPQNPRRIFHRVLSGFFGENSELQTLNADSNTVEES